MHTKLYFGVYIWVHKELYQKSMLLITNKDIKMKVKMKNYICLAFFLIILGILVCQNAYAENPAADELRKRAAILNQKIKLCEQDLADGVEECCVIVNWENNRHISMAEAKNLTTQYLKEAQKAAQKQFDEKKTQIVSNLKGTNSGKLALKTTTEMDEFTSILNDPNSRSKPIDAPITNNQNNRNLLEYSKVINQFRIRRVGNKAVGKVGDEAPEPPRYRTDESTYCNIFVWDVTRAMGAEIPHWVIRGDPNGTSAVDSKGKFTVRSEECYEIRVDKYVDEKGRSVPGIIDWLKEHGETNGWKRTEDARMVQQMANGGHPSIAIWENPDKQKSGHVAIVRPGSIGFPEGPAIAQAGYLVVNAEHLNMGFKSQWKKDKTKIEFWYHE
jgi:hypothetical protein